MADSAISNVRASNVGVARHLPDLAFISRGSPTWSPLSSLTGFERPLHCRGGGVGRWTDSYEALPFTLIASICFCRVASTVAFGYVTKPSPRDHHRVRYASLPPSTTAARSLPPIATVREFESTACRRSPSVGTSNGFGETTSAPWSSSSLTQYRPCHSLAMIPVCAGRMPVRIVE